MDKPAKRLWVRLAPKNRNMTEAGLSFNGPGDCVETRSDVPEVRDALLHGRLQMVMSRPLKQP